MNWKDQFRACLSFEKQCNDLRSPHMVSLRIRLNGEWKEYEADWISSLIREEFPIISISQQTIKDIAKSQEIVDEFVNNIICGLYPSEYDYLKEKFREAIKFGRDSVLDNQ